MPDQERSFKVSNAPLPSQVSLPNGVHDWVLSFDLSKAVMKVRCVEEGKPFEDWSQWFFKEAIGKSYITQSDRETGRIHLRGECLMEGETLYFYREEN